MFLRVDVAGVGFSVVLAPEAVQGVQVAVHIVSGRTSFDLVRVRLDGRAQLHHLFVWQAKEIGKGDSTRKMKQNPKRKPGNVMASVREGQGGGGGGFMRARAHLVSGIAGLSNHWQYFPASREAERQAAVRPW